MIQTFLNKLLYSRMNQIILFLQKQKLLTPEVENLILPPKDGLTKVTDLSFRSQNIKQAAASHVEIGYAWERARSHGKAWVMDAEAVQA